MPAVRTATELGLAIRSRRRELSLDQAELARRIGATRQWVIDIEKGKPRAEVELVMRALHALDLTLRVDADTHTQDSSSMQRRGHSVPSIENVFARLDRPRDAWSPTALERFRQGVMTRRDSRTKTGK
jgi:HTH-type transcriptional regulator / antitoxin HipB